MKQKEKVGRNGESSRLDNILLSSLTDMWEGDVNNAKEKQEVFLNPKPQENRSL